MEPSRAAALINRLKERTFGTCADRPEHVADDVAPAGAAEAPARVVVDLRSNHDAPSGETSGTTNGTSG